MLADLARKYLIGETMEQFKIELERVSTERGVWQMMEGCASASGTVSGELVDNALQMCVERMSQIRAERERRGKSGLWPAAVGKGDITDTEKTSRDVYEAIDCLQHGNVCIWLSDRLIDVSLERKIRKVVKGELKRLLKKAAMAKVIAEGAASLGASPQEVYEADLEEIKSDLEADDCW